MRALPSLLAPLAIAALLLTACGGADEGRPERPTGTTTEALDECAAAEQRVADGWGFQSVIDFEPLDEMDLEELEPTCAPEAPCQFYFNYDKASSPRPEGCNSDSKVLAAFEAVTAPEKAGDRFIAQILPVARCDSSRYAFHMQGQDVATCVKETGRQGWGATLAITLNAEMGDIGLALEPYDASEWDGFSFWVRAGDGPTSAALLASVRDRYTGKPPDTLKDEKYCETADTLPDENGDPMPTPDAIKCDSFGRATLFTAEWRFVKIPFSLLRQKGFGVPSPLGVLDVVNLVALEFGFGAGDWDVWIDDVAFYREPR